MGFGSCDSHHHLLLVVISVLQSYKTYFSTSIVSQTGQTHTGKLNTGWFIKQMVEGITWIVKAGEWKILMTVLGMSGRVMTDNIPCRMAGAEESKVKGKQRRKDRRRITGETTGHWNVSNTG